MTPQPELPVYIDSSMISTFRSCEHKFYEEYVLGLRPSSKSVDLHAGGCFSSALETFYREVYVRGASVDDAKARAMNYLALEWGDFVPDKDTPKTLDNMLVALDDYIRTYAPLTDHIQPLFPDNPTEFSFAIPLEDEAFPHHPVTGDPFIYCGRMDMLGLYQGYPCVKDDKTTKAAGDKWADQWNLRSQFLGYNWGCHQSGIETRHTVIRGVVIQKRQIRQVEAIKQYPIHLIERWYNQLCVDLWQMVRNWETGYWNYNLAESCTGYGTCVYAPICLAKAEHQDSWRSTYVVSRWNPLAKNPLEPAENG